jgi:hypothetical protein
VPWWIFLVAAVVVVVVGALLAFLLLRNVPVPDVRGQARTQAQATLQANSLAVGTVAAVPVPLATPQDRVLEQTPVAGASAARNSAVNLVVSRPPLSPADNDNFSNAVTVSVPGSVVGSTVGATTEAAEPLHAGDARCFIIPTHVYMHTVWFRVLPTASGALTISTANPGTNFDTALAAYTGASMASLALVGCDNNGDGTAADYTGPGGPRTPTWSSVLHLAVSAGQTYFVQLAGIGGATEGTYTLTIDER